jgi:hypothetical protein
MPSMEGKWNAQMTIPEISKNSLPDATDLRSTLVTFLPIRAIHVGEISKPGCLIGCQIHSVGQFLLFPVSAVSVNLQYCAIIPTYPMTSSSVLHKTLWQTISVRNMP